MNLTLIDTKITKNAITTKKNIPFPFQGQQIQTRSKHTTLNINREAYSHNNNKCLKK